MPSDSSPSTATKTTPALPQVPGYEMTELVGGTSEEITLRGRHVESGRAVLAEMYRTRWPTERELAARRHAFEVGTGLRGKSGVVEHLELVDVNTDLSLVLADPGHVSLETWLTTHETTDPLTAARIGLGIARAVAELHGSGVIHNSINPAWVHIEPSKGEAAVRGLSRSSRLRSEAPGASMPATALAYVSPEQTGRMNRPVDARSDLYAMGVILFRLVAGRLPFEEADPLALVHALIARQPPTLIELAPETPATLSEIVATLLAKNAAERYATAHGLAHDLGKLLAGPEPEHDSIQLRTADISDELVLPEGLYGREPELTKLESAVAETCGGDARALFVAGYSGIGKSQLVNEAQPLIVARSGWFGGGKFDLYRRDLPYLGWMGAIEDLVNQALTLPESRLETLKDALLALLGPNAAAITEVVPKLEILVGDHPSLPSATPAETQARFDQAFRKLIRAFATPESPLVLFVDDLQWADLASLRLLEAVLTDPEAGDLLILGAWRENEVGPDHPLQATLRRLTETQVRHDILELGPLPPAAIDAYIADTLHQSPELVTELSSLVADKTGGNPFFMRQFLEELDRDGALRFDAKKRGWVWDLEATGSRGVTENVADLMARRVADLGGSIGNVLQLASCVGDRFSLDPVARLAKLARSEAARALDRALREGLIVPLDDSYRYVAYDDGPIRDSTIDTGYAFAHDRVREAAHDSLDPGARAEAHLELAREMLASTDAKDLEERATLIASHLSEAEHLIVGDEARIEAAQVFLAAGKRAKITMATSSAARFLAGGLRLLGEDPWDHHYDLALALHSEAADVAYIEQRFDDVERYAPTVLQRARTSLDKVPIHNIRIGIGVSKREYRKATEYAVDVLSEDFDITLPKEPTTAHVLAGVVRVKTALRGKTTADLLDLPPMTDPELQAVMGILMKSATNAYWATPNLVPLIAFEMCKLSAEHGNIGLSAYGYALYGMITSAALGQIELGQRFGQLAMDLLDKTGDTHLVGKTALLWHGFIRHNMVPMRECGPDILAAYDIALDAGDVENAVYCATVALYAEVLAGHSLDWLKDRYAGYVEAVLHSGQDQTIGAMRAWLQCIDNLADAEAGTTDLVGDRVDLTTRLPELVEAERGTAIPVEVSAGGFLAFVLGDDHLAEKYLGMAWQRRDEAPGQPFNPVNAALYAVTLIRKGRDMSLSDRVQLVRLRQEVSRRVKHNPHDNEPLAILVKAESRRASGDDSSAQLYLDLAAIAKARGFLHLEAIGLEGAAQVHGDRGHGELAAQLWANATAAWRRYGAHARITRLEERQGGVSERVPEESSRGLSSIDSQTLLETVAAVSGEIELDRLVERVLTLSIRNAGARRGVLLLQDEEGLSVHAHGRVDEDGGVSVESTGTEDDAYSTGIVDYVVRTSEPLVFDDASTEDLFARDPYVSRHRTRSVLCAPLMRSGSLVGVLYLENDLGIGVFTPRHLAMVQTIGGQAAVSLENSRLYEQQRAQAEAFAHFVPMPFLQQLERKRIVDVELGDAVEANLAVLFSDIRGFTSLSERMGIDESFSLINDYLAEMEPPIRKHGGFIDKFIGDAVMALFVEAPEGSVSAGIEMHHALREFNARAGSRTLEMGIGVHFGPAMLGTIGSSGRMETTVIGDTVNTASRLEGLTKPFQAPLLISGELVEHLEQPLAFSLREVGRARAVGKEKSTTVFEVLDARGENEAVMLRGTLAKFETALRGWYEGDLEMARRLFAECAALVPADSLAAGYAARAESQLAEGVPEDWDGTDTRTDK